MKHIPPAEMIQAILARRGITWLPCLTCSGAGIEHAGPDQTGLKFYATCTSCQGHRGAWVRKEPAQCG